MKIGLVLVLLSTVSCGYKWVTWYSPDYRTMEIQDVRARNGADRLAPRMRDALIERCLAGSGFKPISEKGDLVLNTELVSYEERIIATGSDGRTTRLQFTVRVNFSLKDREGKRIWSLTNYQYSDQYPISTSQNEYRDETVFVQDNAMRTIADLVITNITLAIAELERTDG